ncbi:GTPase HflX [SAR116 cluster bacterium]|nr:GTPase HflX [SAR116 cluster bacterium]
MGILSAFVIHPEVRNKPLPRSADAMLAEAVQLVGAIGLEVQHAEVASLRQPRAGTFLGTGYIDKIAQFAEAYDDVLVVVNTTLTPVQQRNLETRLECKVIDRTALILEIFGARAQTHAGRLQVELAAMTFQRSRLVRSWTHLERQRGGGGFLGGPGERQIELDRRMLMERVVRIKKELNEVERTRHLQRGNRARGGTQTVALIGYTNAGKSTLFNRLTGADVLSKDMLFATLDPTMRAIKLPSGREIVMADTVGFISQLPTELVEAFKSTLEEVVQADLLLHVHDAASPLVAEEAGDVQSVLVDLGMDVEQQAGRLLHVLNKSDLLDAGSESTADSEQYDREALANMFAGGTFASALTGAGIEATLEAIDAHLGVDRRSGRITLSPADGAARAWLFERGQVHDAAMSDEGAQTLSLALDEADWARFHSRWPSITTLITPV